MKMIWCWLFKHLWRSPKYYTVIAQNPEHWRYCARCGRTEIKINDVWVRVPNYEFGKRT